MTKGEAWELLRKDGSPEAFFKVWDAAVKTGWKARQQHDVEIARKKSQDIRAANTYRGKVNFMAEQSAAWCDDIAAAIERSE